MILFIRMTLSAAVLVGLGTHGMSLLAVNNEQSVQQARNQARRQHGRRAPLEDRQQAILKAWFIAHALYPYPNEAEKEGLQVETRLTRNQIESWFTKARMRKWPEYLNEARRLGIELRFDAQLLLRLAEQHLQRLAEQHRAHRPGPEANVQDVDLAGMEEDLLDLELGDGSDDSSEEDDAFIR